MEPKRERRDVKDEEKRSTREEQEGKEGGRRKTEERETCPVSKKLSLKISPRQSSVNTAH